MSKLFDQVILLLKQAVNSCSYIRRFNVLMSFVGDNKRVESMLKDNATTFLEAENMLFGVKYEEMVAKSLSLKIDQKSSLVLGKVKAHLRREVEGSLFKKASYLEPEKIRGEECSQLLVKPCHNNKLQEDKEGRMNLLIAPSISSTDLLSPSEFCKIHPLVVNLFPVKLKQLPSAGRMKHFI